MIHVSCIRDRMMRQLHTTSLSSSSLDLPLSIHTSHRDGRSSLRDRSLPSYRNLVLARLQYTVRVRRLSRLRASTVDRCCSSRWNANFLGSNLVRALASSCGTRGIWAISRALVRFWNLKIRWIVVFHSQLLGVERSYVSLLSIFPM